MCLGCGADSHLLKAAERFFLGCSVKGWKRPMRLFGAMARARFFLAALFAAFCAAAAAAFAAALASDLAAGLPAAGLPAAASGAAFAGMACAGTPCEMLLQS